MVHHSPPSYSDLGWHESVALLDRTLPTKICLPKQIIADAPLLPAYHDCSLYDARNQLPRGPFRSTRNRRNYRRRPRASMAAHNHCEHGARCRDSSMLTDDSLHLMTRLIRGDPLLFQGATYILKPLKLRRFMLSF